VVVVMQKDASGLQVEAIVSHLEQVGYDVHRSAGADHTFPGVVHSGAVQGDPRLVQMMERVQEVVTISEPYTRNTLDISAMCLEPVARRGWGVG
jgi:hypothetical protein